MVFAVIDTNVLVSFFLSKKDSPPVEVVRESLGGRITPVFNKYLLEKYREVLSREKFALNEHIVSSLLATIQSFGLQVESIDQGIILPDKKDIPIFEIAMVTRDLDSYLVTGNIKHYPKVDYVVTPKQMMDLLNSGLV